LRTDPGHLIDLVPTILGITGGKQPATVAGMPVPLHPGKSLVPTFKRDGSVKHDFLWWNHDGNRAIRVGDWKLVADHNSPWELFNLRTDRSETNNLAMEYPAKVSELEKVWTKHAEEYNAMLKQDDPPAAQPKNKITVNTK
jgi:arylsulfatase